MPNDVTNILTVSGDPKRRMELFEAIKYEECGIGSIDFSKIIPVPDYIYHGNLGLAEIEKFGKNNWRDWNISNWGSKWNSYGYGECTSNEFDGENLYFQTAWNNVHQVIDRLAEMYPDLEFSYYWADENFGSNVGGIEYINGAKTALHLPDYCSREALELAAKIQQVNLEDEGFFWNENVNEYEYHPDNIEGGV